MKAMKKLIPAVAMLLVSVVTMSTASFAWFSLSRQVTAQGMNVTVTAPTNLLIKLNGAEDTTYGAVATDSTTAASGKLVPASTVDAKAFFIVDTANTPDSGINKDTGALASGATLIAGTDAEGAYIDFVYVIKNQGDAEVEVGVKSITVTKNSSDTDVNHDVKPVRVAVKKADSNWILFAPVSGAVNQTPGQAISAQAGTKGEVTYADISTDYSETVATLASDGTATITIRVWYEGEDTACTNTKGANLIFDVEVVLADKSAPRS